METVIIHNRSFSFGAIQQNGIALLQDDEKVFEQTIALAQKWLNNEQQFVFHTSGSTGTPKEIVLGRIQLLASADATIQALQLSQNEHILACMNTQFIGGAMLLIRGLILGATITLQQPSGNPLASISHHHLYTLASFAPLQVFPLLKNEFGEKEKLNRFSNILVGGAAVELLLESELAKLHTKVFHTYGMTETVSHIALKQIGVDDFYTTVKGVELKTDNRHCLAIKSISTNNQWIQTNDVVELYSAHTFAILGRVDDMINSGGIKIWPNKIEYAIRSVLQHTITNILVCGMRDIKLGEQLIVLLETTSWSKTQEEILKRELAKHLSKFEIPKQYFALSQFIYTQTGKINKVETLKMIEL